MSSTVRVEETILIARPAAEVWEAIADYGFDREWRKGLVEMTPEPPGQPAPGTRVHEVIRSSGREYVADTVVTEVDPGVSYRFTGTGTLGALAGGRAVESDASSGGSLFTYAVELQPAGRMRLLRPVLGRVVRSGLRRDLVALKGLLDTEGPGR